MKFTPFKPLVPLRIADPNREYHLAKQTAEEAASFIRSVLIERLDNLWKERLQPLFEQYRINCEEGEDLQIVQAIQLILFPEEFGTDEDWAKELQGLVPRGGPERCGLDRLNAYANILKASADTHADSADLHATPFATNASPLRLYEDGDDSELALDL